MPRALPAALAALGLCTAAHAGLVRPGFDATPLGRNDDSSVSRALGFSNPLNFAGTNYSALFVNNNGNVTFGSALSAFTPFGLESLNRPIIAPFFADVDTRNTASGITAFGNGTVNGFNAFGVSWRDVGYYSSKADKRNSFQLVLIERSDTGAGNFDVEFNYDRIEWEAGDASRGAGGLGGTAAGIGFASNAQPFVLQLPESGVAGSFLDGNLLKGLIHTSNVGIDGRYVFEFRNGLPVLVPEPGTLGFALALAGFCAAGRFRGTRRR